MARKKISPTKKTRVQRKIRSFKKAIERQIGVKIDWRFVSTAVIAALLIAASKGVLGPKATIIAHHIISAMTAAA